jgi:hypothetical protein
MPGLWKNIMFLDQLLRGRVTADAASANFAQQVRQLRHVDRDPPRLIAR